jgi:putative endonuclease
MSRSAGVPPSSWDPRQVLGLEGEACAVEALEARRYAILDRRVRTRFGEIDIVARDGSTLVFVEVKTRGGVAFGLPEDAITWRKRQRLERLAEAYLAAKGLRGMACRFDVVSVIWRRGEGPLVEVFQNAFDVERR